MTCNFLLLNSDKGKVTAFGPENVKNMVSNQITLAYSSTLRTFGVIIDEDISFNMNFTQISRTE